MKTTLSLLLSTLVCAGCATRNSVPPVALGPRAVAEKAVIIKGRDHRTVVALQPKGTVTVDLESNVSAGYRWKLAAPLDASVLTLVSSSGNPLPPIALAPEGLTRPQPEQWVFRAVGPGTTKVRMIYSRPDQPLNDAVPYEFTVRAE